MAIFNSFLYVYQRVVRGTNPKSPELCPPQGALHEKRSKRPEDFEAKMSKGLQAKFFAHFLCIARAKKQSSNHLANTKQ